MARASETGETNPRRLAVVADDLTGAADAGAGFARAGLRTTITWADPDIDAGLFADADVLAVDAGTRTCDADRAMATTTHVVEQLSRSGVSVLYKKIDSMLRGHIGPEVRAVLAVWGPGSIAIVAPAFPEAGRTTVSGVQRVDGIPIERSSVPALLEEAGLATSLVDVTRVRVDSLLATLEELRGRSVTAIVCDAEVDDDLAAIAEAGVRLGAGVVWVGTGGLAAALGAALGHKTSPRDVPNFVVKGPVLVVVGSTSRIARAQVAHVATAGAAHVVVPLLALDGTDKAKSAAIASDVVGRLRRGMDVVLTVDDRDAGSHDGAQLAATLGDRLRPCAGLVGGLVATGGETAAAVLRAWGIVALRLVDEVEPGVPLSVSAGARSIAVVTKAGSFGSVGTLTRARARLVSARAAHR